jgi:hypothetical protein
VLGAIGAVDRVDERLGDHSVVVVFDLWRQGTQWTDFEANTRPWASTCICHACSSVN